MTDLNAAPRNATGEQWIEKIPCLPRLRSRRAVLLRPETGPKTAEFYFRGHEGEAGPSTALHGPLERSSRAHGIASHEIPSAKSVAERCDLHIGRVGGREELIGRNDSTIQLESRHIRVTRRRGEIGRASCRERV